MTIADGKRGKSCHFVATVGRDVTRGKLSAGRDVALSGKIYQGDMCCIVEMGWQPEGKRKEG